MANKSEKKASKNFRMPCFGASRALDTISSLHCSTQISIIFECPSSLTSDQIRPRSPIAVDLVERGCICFDPYRCQTAVVWHHRHRHRTWSMWIAEPMRCRVLMKFSPSRRLGNEGNANSSQKSRGANLFCLRRAKVHDGCIGLGCSECCWCSRPRRSCFGLLNWSCSARARWLEGTVRQALRN